jgi:hypothetical protein
MGINVIEAQDATTTNASAIPSGVLACGYDTGGGIAWTPAQFAAHNTPYPAIHIDQDPSASDATADILDVESGAATVAEIPGWIIRARAKYAAKVRPSQRWPGIYLSMGNLSAAVSALQGAGIVNVPFWTAQPGIGLAAATQRVVTATGPYPCIGVQYQYNTLTDLNVFNEEWVKTMTGNAVPPTPPPAPANSRPPAPPGEYEKGVVLTGIGLDGNLWITTYSPVTGKWSAPQKIS